MVLLRVLLKYRLRILFSLFFGLIKEKLDQSWIANNAVSK